MWTRRSVLASGAALLASPAGAAETYAAALATAWGGPIDARAAHRQALVEARRLQVRADVLLRGQGLVRGTVAERIGALFADPRFLYPDDDAGRDRAVAEMNGRLAALRPKLAGVFGVAMPAAEVRRMSPADVARGRGGYREPPAYYVDLKAIRERPAWTLPSVAFHETVPGHALQATLQSSDPAKQSYLGVYSEAWATYAEQLAADLGAYAGDPLGEIGDLHWRLFRMARVVADTGLGALGWSAERALAAMRDLQGHAIAFATIEADVARMGRQPGTYAAQGLGALEIARLRPKPRAGWAHFHRAILADGPFPCGMFAAVVRARESAR
ncbi:MAG: DUF885 family protein [Phenylobacterium sp.]|uniref:DUF885 family protein n=1 Tax=Phenylobacterium sp. TaxID=1871053 RepID=UPI0011F4CA79|nr:DUF885 family protein [Phenylobacterium sp.]TAJ69679.1 MAG: DUF885 family protein [Phenylobacterium sp.]